MLFRRKPIRLFELYEPKRFRTTKLDIFVVTVVFIVFTWAFFVDSFRPLEIDGEPVIVMTDRGEMTMVHINMQFFIAPIILCYEMLVIVLLDGKLKGRDLPWGLYLLTFKIMVRDKYREGIEEYRDWRKFKKK